MHVEAIVDGTTYTITEKGITLETGYTGYLVPRIKIDTEQGPDGLIVHSNRIEQRTLDLPLCLKRTSRSAMLEHLRTLAETLLEGDFTLRFTLCGESREVRGVYLIEGPDDDGIDSLDDRDIAKMVLSFLCTDPYWYDAIVNITLVNAITSGAQILFFPFFPMALAPSSQLAQQVITNAGLQTWPVWTITGPGSDLALLNVTTGKVLSFSGLTLSAADTLVIDTRPGIKSIMLNGVTNEWAHVVVASSSLWPLEPGANDIIITMNSTTVDTSVSVFYYPRYLTLTL